MRARHGRVISRPQILFRMHLPHGIKKTSLLVPLVALEFSPPTSVGLELLVKIPTAENFTVKSAKFFAKDKSLYWLHSYFPIVVFRIDTKHLNRAENFRFMKM